MNPRSYTMYRIANSWALNKSQIRPAVRIHSPVHPEMPGAGNAKNEIRFTTQDLRKWR